MIEIDSQQYTAFVKEFRDVPFKLTPAWIHYYKSQEKQALFFVDRPIRPGIICWGISRKSKFSGNILVLYGPILKEGTSVKQLAEFLEGLKSFNHNGIQLNLTTPYSTDFEIAARKAFFKRPIGQSFTNLTILVDTREFKPDRNWKRNLKKAYSENYCFEIKKEVSPDDCRIISKLSKENSDRRNFYDSLSPEEIELLMRYENIFVCLLYNNDKPIAARIISIEQEISYDLFACNSLESRKNGANHYLMEKLFNYLRENQTPYFDFSGIPIGKKNLYGIYEFKISSGGKVVQTNGEWCWYESKYTRHLLYLYQLLFNKQEFY